MKIVAVLLGPSGVGLVGLYMSATTFVGTLAQMGINQSGIREVAEAHASGDPKTLAQNLKTMRRACWVTGILGWVLTAVLAYPLSLWTFGSRTYTPMIAILGSTLLLNFLAGGQTALLQVPAHRRCRALQCSLRNSINYYRYWDILVPWRAGHRSRACLNCRGERVFVLVVHA